MDQQHRVYMELDFQMRKREDLRSQQEITLIALRQWMEREYDQPIDRGYQWKALFLPHAANHGPTPAICALAPGATR